MKTRVRFRFAYFACHDDNIATISSYERTSIYIYIYTNKTTKEKAVFFIDI